MLRRTFFALCAFSLRGETKPPIYELLSSLSSYFSEGNAVGVMSVFSKAMPEYGRVEANVGALTSQSDLICDIEVLDESGDEQKRAAEVTWFFEIKSRENDGPTERREQTVKLAFVREGKRWKIVAVNPVAILDPLKVA